MIVPGEKKYLSQPASNPYPHMGKLLRARLADKKISMAKVAKQLGITTSVGTDYYKRPSVQVAIMWKIGLAIDYNFFAELADLFPSKYEYKQQAALFAEMEQLKKQLAERDEQIRFLQKEVDIYKSVVTTLKG